MLSCTPHAGGSLSARARPAGESSPIGAAPGNPAIRAELFAPPPLLDIIQVAAAAHCALRDARYRSFR
jgi:hypothetical protein